MRERDEIVESKLMNRTRSWLEDDYAMSVARRCEEECPKKCELNQEKERRAKQDRMNPKRRTRKD